MSDSTPIDRAEFRRRLFSRKGPEYWRSLDELANTEEFREFLHREFPREASVWEGTLDRRSFLQIMGASLALGGLSSCMKQPDQKIIPYIKQPEIIVPGVPLQFATACVQDGFATGVLATSHMGRPTRIDGNPDHPASLGATDVFTTASILSLYDPDRSQSVIHNGEISTWDKFKAALDIRLGIQRSLNGSGLRILTGTVTSPSLGAQMDALLSAFPGARWHQFDPVNLDAIREGSIMAFGEYVQTRYQFDQADVILSLDADFLGSGHGHVRYARDFAAKRRVGKDKDSMNRLYVAELSPTITGSVADHRLPTHPAQLEKIVRMVASRLEVPGSTPGMSTGDSATDHWVVNATNDLKANPKSSMVLAGQFASPGMHAIVHGINRALGNMGTTIVHTDPVEYSPVNQVASLQSLVDDIVSGEVDLLVVMGGNPAYTAPSDIDLATMLGKVECSVHLGLYADETSRGCSWHVPQTHALEAWGDARSYDGTATIMQPLIAPLYESAVPANQLIEIMLGGTRKDHEIVKSYWKSRLRSIDFEDLWKSTLNSGRVEGTSLSPRNVTANVPSKTWTLPGSASSDGLDVIIRPDPSIWDGTYSNNGWLQELPKPLTKLTWDNAAILGPATADRLGLTKEQLVELHYNGRVTKAPVLILPGHPDHSVTLHLGYGRTASGIVGNDRGANVYSLQSSAARWQGSGLRIQATGETYPLAVTQNHHALEGRDIILAATRDEYLKHRDLGKDFGDPPASEETLYPKYNYDGYAWGMSIDLNACTGCNACIIACQSENNIPIVGKEQVMNGREMQWIRVDDYYKGDPENPEVLHQPLACVHCENAPCEVVCPVGATNHDSEGLNVMVYNRCIGTRYCSDNCPYKVRRFNFLEYSSGFSETEKMEKNPDVTVRSRGVMEKCTYCIQRISAARITAKKEGREIQDGDVVTACQSACPTQAIVFGNINDRKSAVAERKSEGRTYSLLASLNTVPRTSYLAKLSNPNPDMEPGS